jgi:ABC-type cobalamin/Fe3+-siderophores transport system ATPase subunit
MAQNYKYKLPNASEQPEEKNANSNSLIIIGANGSGKSKLGAWMEQQDMDNTHRVGAQRSLNFGEFIQLKSYEQAENLLLYGQEKKELLKNGRWSWNYDKQNFTTQLLFDYENVLAALVAMKNNENDVFIKDCKEREKTEQQHKHTPNTVVDTLKRIWKNVFPQRDIDFDDAKVTATLNKSDGKKVSYKGLEMSDGERVGLYLIAQCLCIPENKTIIIDEPEIHLHRSIMNRLWTEIEKERQDCFFIYITHDTQFAANHKQAKKIWVKNFDGINWDLEEINESIFPEQLLLDILGNRKKVIFVEGEANSYDTKLYREIYKDYYIIPCGGCTTVIAQTKAMKNTPQLHELECFGIIDRDFRSEHEINSLKNNNIYTLNVAEVENLFLVEELLEVVNKILVKQDGMNIDNIKKHVIEDRFLKEINKQILEATVSEAKYQLSIIEIPKNDENAAKQELNELKIDIDFNKIKSEQEKKFNDILSAKNYKQVLSVFNRKDVVKSIGHYFDLNDKGYCDFVIRQLQGDKSQEVINAIKPYLPTEIKTIEI